jgi:2-dehydropantoate 2-reductase
VNSLGEVKKISVVGAGALGTLVGGLIKHHLPAIEIVLVGRGPHLHAMKNAGNALLRGPWGSYTVPVMATEDSESVRGSDLVLFTVKTQDTKQTAKAFADVCGQAIIVSLQNGINQRELVKFFRHDRLLVGMTATNMTSLEPGIVEFHRNGVSVIGPATTNVSPETLERAKRILSLSKLRFEVDNTIMGVQYNKLLFNTMGYASVLSASDFIRDGLINTGWRKNIAIPLLDEGMRVLKTAGIELRRAPGGSDVIRLRKVMRLLNTPGMDAVAKTAIGLLNPPRLVFSVFQDLKRKRPTEIDFVNGEIVRLAEESGCEAPYNHKVVQAIHELERSEEIRFLEHQKVIDRFRELRRQGKATR